MSVVTILLICALVCFGLATANLPTGVSLGWLGMVFLTIIMLISGGHVAL